MATLSRVGFVRCFVLLTAMVGQSLLASNTWIRLSTSDFELYTSLDQKRAAVLMRRLEEARQATEQLSLGAQPNHVPLLVFAFGSRGEYIPFRSDKGATAYYLSAAGRNYIVVGGDAIDSAEALVHEYVHYVLHQRFPHLPLWLDEGLAEVYSTVTRTEGSLRVGLPSEDQLGWLRMDGLGYNLPALFGIEQTSFDHAKHLTPRSRFYAESWLLVHMLRLAPEYEAGFPAFLTAMAQGEGVEQVLLRVYGKKVAKVRSDLERYLDAERMPTEVITASHLKSKVEAIEPSPVSVGQTSEALARLSAALGRGL